MATDGKVGHKEDVTKDTVRQRKQVLNIWVQN